MSQHDDDEHDADDDGDRGDDLVLDRFFEFLFHGPSLLIVGLFD